MDSTNRPTLIDLATNESAVSDEAAAKFDETGGSSWSHQSDRSTRRSTDFQGTTARRFAFDMVFDVLTKKNQDVQALVARVKKFVGEGLKGGKEPPVCLLVWGIVRCPVLLDSVDVSYDRFDDHGKPERATLSVVATEVRDDRVQRAISGVAGKVRQAAGAMTGTLSQAAAQVAATTEAVRARAQQVMDSAKSEAKKVMNQLNETRQAVEKEVRQNVEIVQKELDAAKKKVMAAKEEVERSVEEVKSAVTKEYEALRKDYEDKRQAIEENIDKARDEVEQFQSEVDDFKNKAVELRNKTIAAATDVKAEFQQNVAIAEERLHRAMEDGVETARSGIRKLESAKSRAEDAWESAEQQARSIQTQAEDKFEEMANECGEARKEIQGIPEKAMTAVQGANERINAEWGALLKALKIEDTSSVPSPPTLPDEQSAPTAASVPHKSDTPEPPAPDETAGSSTTATHEQDAPAAPQSSEQQGAGPIASVSQESAAPELPAPDEAAGSSTTATHEQDAPAAPQSSEQQGAETAVGVTKDGAPPRTDKSETSSNLPDAIRTALEHNSNAKERLKMEVAEEDRLSERANELATSLNQSAAEIMRAAARAGKGLGF